MKGNGGVRENKLNLREILKDKPKCEEITAEIVS